MHLRGTDFASLLGFQVTTQEYDLISISDLNEVNELLIDEFFRNEPLGKHLGANPETDVRPWISEVTKPLIDQGVSIIEFCPIIYDILSLNSLLFGTLIKSRYF